jgi:hypothetical protein
MKSFVVGLMGTALVSLVTVSSAGAAPLKSWDTVINKPSRFKVLTAFNSEAVLDKETGLVWQRDAGAASVGGCINPFHWAGAVNCCSSATIGGRGGWRLPTMTELFSLVDVTQSNPALPLGHPFTNVQNTYYWTSSEQASNAATPDLTYTRATNLADGTRASGVGKTNLLNYWCVRGPGPQ